MLLKILLGFGIRSIPTLMLFEKGSTKWSRVGVHSKDLLRELLKLDARGETR